MSHYKSNLRDLEFNLFEVLARDEVLGTGPFEEIDSDTARSILGEVDRLGLSDDAARALVLPRAVAVERVRLDKETVTDQETVSEQVRKEQIELEGDADTKR